MSDYDRLRRFARDMRKEPTYSEAALWHRLRRKQLGVRFRRQEPIGPFIPDFVCFKHRLIIEVDGGAHQDLRYDRMRDRWFIAHGWFVLRVWDTDVLDQIDWTMDRIRQALDDPRSVDDPLGLKNRW